MSMHQATLHTDGGARGNPGPAGIGYVLAIDGGPTINGGEYIGEATNNQAEYRALVRGLQVAKEHQVSKLHCYLDSELVVKQLTGEYRVRHADLRQLYDQARRLADTFAQIAFRHVPRAKNATADALVNEALDIALK